MMNISEFERKKPKETLKKITELEDYLAECQTYGLSHASITTVQEHIKLIKDNFLAGN